jgi:hypothetical protein
VSEYSVNGEFFRAMGPDGYGVPKTNKDRALRRHVILCEGSGGTYCETKDCPHGKKWRATQPEHSKYRKIDEPTQTGETA